jgi:signal transduction histidine kinase
MDKVVRIETESVWMSVERFGINFLLMSEQGEVLSLSKPLGEVLTELSGVNFVPGAFPLAAEPEQPHLRATAWVQALQTGLGGTEATTVLCFYRHTREYYWELKIHPFVSSLGSRYIVALARDTTQQFRADRQLVDQNKALKKVNSELDRFIYSVSHDLRAPVTSIQGLINVLRLEEFNPQGLTTFLDMMEKTVKKLDHFIRSIVDYSHNVRHESVDIQTINFDTLLPYVINRFHYLEGFNRVAVTTRVDATVPFATDYSRMVSILLNVIMNGFIFYDANKASYLNIAVTTAPGHALLEFEDNGIGIGEEHHDKVFQMFYRASALSHGSGLGLYLVKEAVEKLGGAISLQSQKGVGTRLRIELPNLSLTATQTQ